MWAEKEMHNLTRMRAAGMRCPDVVLLKKHVLVMSFIGSGGVPAPKIREAALSSAQVQIAYQQVCDMMHQLYRECNLIHAVSIARFLTLFIKLMVPVNYLDAIVIF